MIRRRQDKKIAFLGSAPSRFRRMGNHWPLVRTGTVEAIGLGSGVPVLLPGFLQTVQQLEKDPSGLIPNGAARLLAMRRPPGAAEALLAYVPFAEDETEADELQGALTTLAFLR